MLWALTVKVTVSVDGKDVSYLTTSFFGPNYKGLGYEFQINGSAVGVIILHENANFSSSYDIFYDNDDLSSWISWFPSTLGLWAMDCDPFMPLFLHWVSTVDFNYAYSLMQILATIHPILSLLLCNAVVFYLWVRRWSNITIPTLVFLPITASNNWVEISRFSIWSDRIGFVAHVICGCWLGHECRPERTCFFSYTLIINGIIWSISCFSCSAYSAH